MSKPLQSYVQSNEPVYLDNNTYQLIKSALEYKEKLEKAWEICKNNIVNLDMISKSESWGYYDGYCAKHYFPRITKDEFNLLKEMLSNEKMDHHS